MYINVSQLLKESSGSSRTFEVDTVLTPTDGTQARVLGSGKLLRTDKGIWLSATLDSEVLCMCSRCLVEHEQPVHMVIEEEFFPVVDITTGGRLDPAGDKEERFYIDQHHILDLTEAAKQYLVLNIPMKPICREDCAGICSICGVNLNETSCGCDKRPRDARWGALREAVSSNDAITDRGP